MLVAIFGKWSLGMLWVAVMVSALAVVWATNDTRLRTGQLLSLRAEANNLFGGPRTVAIARAGAYFRRRSGTSCDR